MVTEHTPPQRSSIPKQSFLARLTQKVRRKSHEKHDKENAEKSKGSAAALGSKRKHKHKDTVVSITCCLQFSLIIQQGYVILIKN